MSIRKDKLNGVSASPGEMRREAENCFAVARATEDAATRIALLGMASRWLQRAQAAEPERTAGRKPRH